LIDLGLARFRQTWGDDAVGSIGGTAAYMSPEQSLGIEDRIGPLTDVFGLGGILYYLLTGRPVYHSTTQYGVLRQASRGEQVAPRQVNPQVPRALERICLRALAPDLDRRYRAAEKFEAALHAYLRRKVVAAAVLIAFALPAIIYGILRPGPTAKPDIHASTVAVATPRVLSFEIRHYRGDNPPLSLGMFGVSSWTALDDDDVRVHARVDATACYCYLIDLNPAGGVKLRHETTSDEPQQVELSYPLGEKYFPLNDGSGWQTFILLVSREPLPPSAGWIDRVLPLWKPAPVDITDCVWTFDGNLYEPACRKSRGDPREHAAAPRAFKDVCDYLKNLPGVDAIRAVAFAVTPK
jgi:hypothetical protein